MIDDPKSLDWKRTAQLYMMEAVPVDKRPLYSDTPLRCRLEFRFPLAKTKHRKRNPVPETPHIGAKDLDNLIKAVLDAGIGILWADDGVVCELAARKMVCHQEEDPATILEVHER